MKIQLNGHITEVSHDSILSQLMTCGELKAVEIRSGVPEPGSSGAHADAIMALLGRLESASSALINGAN